MDRETVGYARNLHAAERTSGVSLGSLKGSAAPPSPTEMQSLGEKLGFAAKVLEETADRLRGRVDEFTNRIQAAGVDAVDPIPPAGTLAALHYWVRCIDLQAKRLSEAADDVATIL